MLIICVGLLKFPEQLLVRQAAVVQISHDGSPALVLKVFIVHQAFTKRAEFVGNFKHFLGRRSRKSVGDIPSTIILKERRVNDKKKVPEQVVFERQQCERRLASLETLPL